MKKRKNNQTLKQRGKQNLPDTEKFETQLAQQRCFPPEHQRKKEDDGLG
jgi:hypothetical protein